jgi:hypothetical protein
MANLYWNNEKTDRDIAIKKLMETLPDYTPSAFTVKQEGDDSGSYLCVYVERTENEEEICKQLPMKFEGWRVVHVWCPHDYIKVIMYAKRE